MGAPLRGPSAWDAWGGARRGAAADARHLGVHQPWAGGAEKLVDRAQDDRERGESLRSELRGAERQNLEHLDFETQKLRRAAPAAGLAARELCTPDAGPSAERSCAAREAAAVPALRVVRPVARWRKSLEALRRLEFALPEAERRGALTQVWMRQATRRLALMRFAKGQPVELADAAEPLALPGLLQRAAESRRRVAAAEEQSSAAPAE